MIAKVIAHAPHALGAINKLQRALGQAHLIGPITNRTQLLGLLPELADHWQQIDTGWLDGHPPTDPQIEPAFVAAAALAWARSQRTPLTRFAAGWRNNHSQLQQVRVGPHDVRYRYDRSGSVAEATVDGVAVGDGWLPALDFIETEIDGDVVFVSRGQYRFLVPPRYAPPDDAGRAGSTVAPMPGSILRVVVDVGDVVVAGQPLLAMEAMKMEHQVVSPVAGTVAECSYKPASRSTPGNRWSGSNHRESGSPDPHRQLQRVLRRSAIGGERDGRRRRHRRADRRLAGRADHAHPAQAAGAQQRTRIRIDVPHADGAGPRHLRRARNQGCQQRGRAQPWWLRRQGAPDRRSVGHRGQRRTRRR